MSRFFSILAILFILCPAASIASDGLTPDSLPRLFVGTFHWDDRADGDVDQVTLSISKTEIRDGVVVFEGTNDYDEGLAVMKVRGTIDPTSKKIVLIEHETVVDYYNEIDGAFNGEISFDGRKISARWKTKSTGRGGSLELLAK
jgi:hypothetical protein